MCDIKKLSIYLSDIKLISIPGSDQLRELHNQRTGHCA